MCCVKDTFQRRNLADWSIRIEERTKTRRVSGPLSSCVWRGLLEELPKQVIHYGAVAVIIEHIG